ncbi:MAG: hypothetical protein WBP59_09445 [Ilumatobacteraceae bacterium]
MRTQESPSTSKVEWLTVAGDPAIWQSIGLTLIDADAPGDEAAEITGDRAEEGRGAGGPGDGGLIPLIGTSIRVVSLDDAATSPGLIGWALSGDGVDSGDAWAADSVGIDGLPTQIVDPQVPTFAAHPLGASALDHVVIATNDLERTSGAIAAATGCELKRVRDLGAMRQGFHRIGRGGLIVELVERADAPSGPASFWGLVLIVDDIDAACELIGTDRVSTPKDAVQPGRRIATIRSEVGLGLPVALMTA